VGATTAVAPSRHGASWSSRHAIPERTLRVPCCAEGRNPASRNLARPPPRSRAQSSRCSWLPRSQTALLSACRNQISSPLQSRDLGALRLDQITTKRIFLVRLESGALAIQGLQRRGASMHIPDPQFDEAFCVAGTHHNNCAFSWCRARSFSPFDRASVCQSVSASVTATRYYVSYPASYAGPMDLLPCPVSQKDPVAGQGG